MNFDPPVSDRLSPATADGLLLLGRVFLGAIFVTSGFGKLLALGAFATSLESRGVPAAQVMALVAAAVEFFGGLLIIIGLQTRAAAVLLIIFVVIATLIAHRYWDFTDAAARRTQQSQFFKNLSIIGGFVLLIASGAGRYSIDRILKRRKDAG